MKPYHFDPLNRFVIEDFDVAPPFASFLPGIAGPLGIPLWAFYVNRGQAIASFGVGSKDMPIMEFQPANKAYQTVPYTGFRTFIKVCDAADGFYEPFSASARPAPTRRMFIGPSEIELEETSPTRGLQVNVLYFTLPGEPFAGLVRQVTVRNVSARPVTLEILDGLPIVIPCGLNDTMLKKISRTAEAWMAVFNLDAGVPFYRVQASVGDEAEVEAIEEGHFYLAFAQGSDLTGLVTIVDPAIVFGANTALSYPDRFLSHSLAELRATPQATVCRTPCGFAGASATLAPGEALTLYAIIGHVSQAAVINGQRDRLAQPAYIAAKRAEAQALTQESYRSDCCTNRRPPFRCLLPAEPAGQHPARRLAGTVGWPHLPSVRSQARRSGARLQRVLSACGVLFAGQCQLSRRQPESAQRRAAESRRR